jgi:hypothetical protein
MRRWAIGFFVLVLLVGAVKVVRPFVATQRDQATEIPSPASLVSTSTVPLAPGKPVCFDNAVAERHSEVIRFKISSPAGPAPAMRVTIKGPGYDAKADIPAGLQDTQTAQAFIPAPGRDVPVRVCISNQGDLPIALFSSNDRTRSRSIAFIGDTSTGESVWFGFFEPSARAITEQIPSTIERMTVFRPHWVKVWLLWIIAVLFLVATPIAVVWAYVRSLRADGVDDLTTFNVERRRSWWQRYVD